MSNCGNLPERVSEVSEHHLKSITQKGRFYIKFMGYLINKVKKLRNVTEGATLMATDVIGLYPSIPRGIRLKTLKMLLDNRK